MSEHTAQKRFRCDSCRRWIRKGERYVRATLPPGAKGNPGPTHRILRLHGPNRSGCPTAPAPLASDAERPDPDEEVPT